MINEMRLPPRLAKGVMFIVALLLLALVPACKSTGGASDRACSNEEKLGLEDTCFAVTLLTQGSRFPNPVQAGGTVKLKMKIGAISNPQLSPIPATVSTRVLSSVTGALVTQQTQPAIPSMGNFQDVPIWTNIAVAPGIYVLEVTVNVGGCGFKKICLSGDQRIVVQ